jgi:hypothetical protein
VSAPRSLRLALEFIRAQGGTVQHTPRDAASAHDRIAAQQSVPSGTRPAVFTHTVRCGNCCHEAEPCASCERQNAAERERVRIARSAPPGDGR